MAPRALMEIGGLLAKEAIKRVAEQRFKAHGRGRRLGGSGNSLRHLEGIKRVLSFGLDKVEEAGGVKNMIHRGVAKTKREGFVKVAKEVMNLASQGLVRLISPPGFHVTFKPDGNCVVYVNGGPSSEEVIFNGLQEAPPAVVTKEEPSDTGDGDWQYCEIISDNLKLELKD
ncbi:uncharacterized protein [Palaemon carinicauda]|uniref:uncharacterized protein n=1 Tax=Palaemon carinicauda TaxID=392227 RepID=UPI0035B5C82B